MAEQDRSERKRRDGDSHSKRERSRSDRHSSSHSSSSRHGASAAAASSHSSSSHRPASSSASSSHRRPSSSSRPPVDVAKAAKSFIPDAGAAGSSAAKKPKSEFLCDLVYANTLPDVPFEPKLLKVYLPGERLSRYCASSLEASLRMPFVTDKLLGIPFDLVHPAQYVRPAYMGSGKIALDAADQAIMPTLKDEKAVFSQPTQLQLFQQGSSNWLRKQEFQSNNLYDMAIRTTGAAEQIQKEFARVEAEKVKLKSENTKEKQVELIERTFEAAKKAPVHPTNKSLRVVSSQDIFPLFGSDGQYIQAHNALFDEQALGPDGEPVFTEDEIDAQRKAARFNIDYAWTEFDYAPIEEKKEETPVAEPSADGAAAAAAASTPAGKLIPLLQSYSEQYHGLYVLDPAHPEGESDVAKPPAPGGDTDEEGDADAVASSVAAHAALLAREAEDPNLIAREFFRWQREYTKMNTPAVERDNNFFFVVRRGDAAANQHISYAQYGARMKLGKRTKTRSDRMFSEIAGRPSAVRLQYVREYTAVDSKEPSAPAAERKVKREKRKAVKQEEVEEDEEAEAEDAAEGEDDAEAEGAEGEAAAASGEEAEAAPAEDGENADMPDAEADEAAVKEKKLKKEKKREKKKEKSVKKEKKRSKYEAE